MVKSMTGYGRAEDTVNGYSITVELRSVNNRYLDCNVRIPRLFLFAEEAIKARVQNSISRGKVDVFVTMENTSQELAGNSDHYPFAQRNVPCIFFMNEGGDAFKYYHTIYDTWSNSIFSSYEPTFKLITDFVDQYK